MHMNIKRCVNCMEDMGNISDTVCPRCRFDNANAAQLQSPLAMRQNSILHGRYLIGRVLGQGGFGITYIAFDFVLGIKVAVKEYFPMGMVTRDPGSTNTLLWHATQMNTEQRQSGQESFLKEARRIAKIDQIPSIVRVRDTFFENETAYIVMDFVDGITLKDKLLKGGAISFHECMRYLTPLMEGLVQVHRAGIIHRDISPDNIMIQADGSVKLLDLGAAKDISTGQGQQSQLVAKKGFSPLEQYTETGHIGPWTDVYALCATIYYSITGKLVPNALDRIGDSQEIVFPEGMKESVPAYVREALEAGLAVEAGRRIQSVEDLLTRLKGVNANVSEDKSARVREQAVSTAGKSRSGNRKNRKRRVWVGIAAALGILVVIVSLAGGHDERDQTPATGGLAEGQSGEKTEGGADAELAYGADIDGQEKALTVERLGTSNANLFNMGTNVLTDDDYEFFLAADSALYVCKYNGEKSGFYPDSGDKICDSASYLTVGEDKIYFLTNADGHSAICQADKNGEKVILLYPVAGREELSYLQYVKLSDQREYLYFLQENVAGEPGASLWLYDLSSDEAQLLIEEDLYWYNLYGDSLYYRYWPKNVGNMEYLLMRAGLDGQGGEVLGSDMQLIPCFVEEDTLYLISVREESPSLLAYHLDGTPKKGYEGLGDLAVELGSGSLCYEKGWIYYTGVDGNIHRVRENGIGDSVVLQGHSARFICCNGDWMWFYEETESEKDFRQLKGQAYFAKYDGDGLVEAREADYSWGLTVAEEEDFQYREYVDAVSSINVGRSSGVSQRWMKGHDFGLGDAQAIVITGYTGELTDFEIPRTIDGKLVVGIGEKAFFGAPIHEIGLPKGLRFIEESAFQGCAELEYVLLPEGLEVLGSKAFRECGKLTSAILPEGLTWLDDMVFMDTSLSYVNIPSTVEYISSSAFSVLPGSGLTEYVINGSNDRYWEYEGALYKTTWYEADTEGRVTTSALVQVPVDYEGTLVIPEGVNEIGDYALYRCEKLTGVTIPTSVRQIESNAFKGTLLREITVSRGCELPSELGCELTVKYY